MVSPLSGPYQAPRGRNGLIRLKDDRQREQNGALQTARRVNYFVNQFTLEVMKTSVVLWASLSFVSGIAVAADPHCGSAPRCVARVEYDSRLTEFHKRVLESMQLPYTLEDREGRVAVWWVPRSEAEENEVDGR